MHQKFLVTVAFVAFFSTLSLIPQYALAATPADGGPCTVTGQVATASDGHGGTITLVCNSGVLYQGVLQHWYESCSSSPIPTGCPGTSAPVVPGGTPTPVGVIQAPTTPSPTTGYCRPGKDAIVDMPWPGFSSRAQVRPLTNGFNNSTVSFRIVVPPLSSAAPATLYYLPKDALVGSNETYLTGPKTGFIHIAETPGSRTTDHITNISKIPCDLYHSPITKAGPSGTAPGFNYGIWDRPGYGTEASNFPLMFHPGEVIYVNVTHDTAGYGAIPTLPSYQNITNTQTCNAGGCDILFDFAIPQAGTYAPDVQANGTPWPQDPQSAGWPLYSEAYDRAHPVSTCSIRYGIDNAGHAAFSAIDQQQHTTTGDHILSSRCYVDSLLAEISRGKALSGVSAGVSIAPLAVGGVPIGSPVDSNQIKLTFGNTSITLTNEAAAAIIQNLAQNAGVSAGVTVNAAPTGVSMTVDGHTFVGATNAALAAQYLQFLQNQQHNDPNNVLTPGASSNPGVFLTTNLAPGDYNPADQVSVLQGFLNSELGAVLAITGFFNDQTLGEVVKLQVKYPAQTYRKAGLTSATGFVGQYTRDLINAKLAAALGVTPPVIPPASSPGVMVTNYCTGSDQIIPVAWPASGQVRPQTTSFKDQKMAFKITVPATFSPALNTSHIGFMHIAELSSEAGAFLPRDITVSRNPCDFQSGSYLYNGIGHGNSNPSANFTVNNPTNYSSPSIGANFNLQSGDTVYLNVRNANNGVPVCSSPACNVLFDFATPNRY